MCEVVGGAALVLSPSNDCYRSRSCSFSRLTQDVSANNRIELTKEVSLILLDDRAAERQAVCYLLYGEAFAAEHDEYLRAQLVGGESGTVLKQGIVKLVYSRQSDAGRASRAADVVEAPAGLSISYLRWLLLETALRRFQYPRVEFGRFRFCHVDALLSSCLEQDEASDRSTEQAVKGRWASETATLTLGLEEVQEAMSFFERRGEGDVEGSGGVSSLVEREALYL
eukprot:23955-Hanusia_phi.AAC.1